MSDLSIEQIFSMGQDEVWAIPKGEYQVTFVDGVMTMTDREIKYDRQLKKMYELFPSVRMSMSCSIKSILAGKMLNMSSNIRWLEKSFRYICDTLGIRYYKDKEQLLERCVECHNDLFNYVYLKMGASLLTVDALDFLHLMRDPEIVRIKENIINTPMSVDNAHKETIAWLKDSTSSRPYVIANQSGAVSNSQFNQCVGPRGFVAELDRTVREKAIMNGYIEGYYTLYDMMADSRTAAKALNAAGAAIQKTEYASRRFQILAMVIRHPISYDCGSTSFKERYVTKRNLPNLIGKWYKLNEDDTELHFIDGTEEHLIGEKIYHRHVKGCIHPNRNDICTTCLGRISENLLYNTNLGAESSFTFMKDVTQGQLSLKHEVRSITGSSVVLDEVASFYFTPTEQNELKIRDELETKGLNLILGSNDLDKLMDVLSIEDSTIPMENIGELSVVTFNRERTAEAIVATVSNEDRKANITKELLEYIKVCSYTLNDRGNYVIPLDDWNKDDPIFVIPLKEVNMSKYVTQIEAMVESTDKRKMSYDDRLDKLFDTILERSNCNIMIVEILAYATSAFNPAQKNFRLARNSPDFQHVNKRDIYKFRSKSQLLAFERQADLMFKDPIALLNDTYSEYHPFDVQFMPKEVLAALH